MDMYEGFFILRSDNCVRWGVVHRFRVARTISWRDVQHRAHVCVKVSLVISIIFSCFIHVSSMIFVVPALSLRHHVPVRKSVVKRISA